MNGALSEIRDALGSRGWRDDPKDLAPHLTAWRGGWQGSAALLALPASLDEVAAVVRICAAHRLPVTVQGGNTGLVGGQIPDGGGILISTTRLMQVREVDPLEDVLIAEAGVTISSLHAAAAAADRLFPLSYASEGSATIGGAIATNAGGTAVLRYGTTRDLVLGVEAVLPDGSIYSGLDRLRKNTTGYDIKQLLIGAEGTLGIVTAAVVKMFPRMRSRAVALTGLRDVRDATALLALAKARCAGNISAFELMSGLGVRLATQHVHGVRDPLDAPQAWYVLMELGYLHEGEAEHHLEALLAEAFEADIVADGAIAQSDAHRADFWRLRETQSEAQKAEGPSWSFDISVPASRMPAFITAAAEALANLDVEARPMPFGHLGDGNIHYNVLQPEGAPTAQETDPVSSLVYALVDRFGGSIAAEHGIGRAKKSVNATYKDVVALRTMRRIKSALDEKSIMNPAVLFEDAGSDDV